MSDSIIIPLKIEGEEKAQVAFNEVIGSLSRVQRKMLEMGGASEEGQRAILGLTQKFKQGEISAEEFRTSLIRLAGDAPKTAQEFAKAAREAEKLAAKESLAAQEAEKLARETKKAGDEAGNAAPKVKTLGERFAGLATGARHANELAEFTSRLGSAVHGTATRIGELAAEQQRLDANSVRLGLNFRQAAEQAGGFVSEVETMTLATSLADRGIRATQEELNALARVGMSRAAATGKNLGEVFDSLTDSVLEGGEEMGKFGGNLLRVSDGTHTAGERMRAFVDHAKQVPPTMRTAADEMARFNRAVHDAQRTVASAFAEEFGRLLTLPTAMRDSANNAEDLNTQLRAVGMTAAYVVNLVATGAAAALGFLVTATATVLDNMMQIGTTLGAISGLGGRSAAAAARRAQGLPERREDSYLSTVRGFTEGAAARFAALLNDQDQQRTSADAGRTPTLASVREARARDARERARRQSPGGGSAGTVASDVELARIDAALEIAARLTPAMREARYGMDYDEVGGVVVRARDVIARLRQERIDVLRGQLGERRQGESGRDRRRRIAQTSARIDELNAELRATGESEAATGRREFGAAQGTAREAYGRVSAGLRERAESSIEKERNDATARREAETRKGQEAKSRVEQDRSFTQELEDLSGRRVSVARREAEAVSFAFQTMGKAVSTHLVAVLQGKEELGAALQAMLADTLSAISQEATVKAGLELAGGFAALATYRYDAAAQHFAAAGIYTAVAAASGVAGAALTPQAKGASSAPSGGGNDRDRSAAPMSQGSTTGGGTTVINVAFNGPQFGTGGVVQAARQLAGVLNAGAVQGGVQLNRLALAGTR